MSIDEIRQLASDLYDIRVRKKALEEEIKQCNKDIKRIEEGSLNEAMLDSEITRVELNGMDISKTLVFRGGYTTHENPEAFQFLFDSNNDGALQKHLIVDLEAYPRAAFVLMEHDIEYTTKYSIHHATLSSIIKELVEAGRFSTEDIEKYDVYVQPQIKIKKRTGETE